MDGLGASDPGLAPWPDSHTGSLSFGLALCLSVDSVIDLNCEVENDFDATLEGRADGEAGPREGLRDAFESSLVLVPREADVVEEEVVIGDATTLSETVRNPVNEGCLEISALGRADRGLREVDDTLSLSFAVGPDSETLRNAVNEDCLEITDRGEEEFRGVDNTLSLSFPACDTVLDIDVDELFNETLGERDGLEGTLVRGIEIVWFWERGREVVGFREERLCASKMEGLECYQCYTQWLTGMIGCGTRRSTGRSGRTSRRRHFGREIKF